MLPSFQELVKKRSSYKRSYYILLRKNNPFTQVVVDRSIFIRKFAGDRLELNLTLKTPVFKSKILRLTEEAHVVEHTRILTTLGSQFILTFHLKNIVRRICSRLVIFKDCCTFPGYIKVLFFGNIVRNVNDLGWSELTTFFRKILAKVNSHSELLEITLSWNYYEIDNRASVAVRDEMQYINEDVLFSEPAFPSSFSDSYVEILFVKIVKLCFRGIAITNIQDSVSDFEHVIFLIEQALSHISIIGTFNKFDYLE